MRGQLRRVHCFENCANRLPTSRTSSKRLSAVALALPSAAPLTTAGTGPHCVESCTRRIASSTAYIAGSPRRFPAQVLHGEAGCCPPADCQPDSNSPFSGADACALPS
jgi:hypothetical protein